MIYVIPISCFTLALVAGLIALAHRKDRAVLIAGILLLVLFVGMLLQGRQTQGWDGLGYVIGAFLMAAPAFLGLVAGSLLGVLRRRRMNGQ